MNVRTLARISPRQSRGSSAARLNPLDETASARRLEARAELTCLVRRGEWTDHGAVIDAFFAEIDLADHRLSAAELARELGLQATKSGFGLGLAATRRELHRILTGTAGCFA